ncbi:MAG TPA: acyl-CoA thioesterase [Candidatus Thermoplasmatota archaeon]|nr:acyl-CoA thioesterase [Candidatus Thermoplasmatota archaeon]
MGHVERMRVSYRDVDMMDHVNNAAYFTYFETARCHYYEALTGLKEIHRLDIIVAKQSCEYLRGLRYDEAFDVVAWPSRIGTTSFTLSYALRTVKGEVVALGETVIVMFDYAKNAKKPLEGALRARLEADHKKGPGIGLPS